ncbi:NADP-dependent oxidoreductase [Bacillus sp. AFS055030]|uniref:NADP-dependent oxidoreductase n=1 Tax=Bacillus sp. AFS055030 TaxID=2033507 RepID=UPI000BFDDA9F|nr:NADP-dependent oxidoreductase [Bacillus sp. AFS055030]PGL71024.1 Zn-dependent oxidoreductase [Bacillus sp. AFS055030]
MKAVGYCKYGGPSVFEEFQVIVPEMNSNQVLVKVLYSSIHPVETIVRSGAWSGGIPLNRVVFPGTEVLGIVEKIGSQVTNVHVGETVIAKVQNAGYAEYVVADNNRIFKKPEDMDIEIAAGFSGVGITAYWALIGYGRIKKGETVVILGASGGVGSIAAQIAKDCGLTVIGVASTKNEEYVLSLGADRFVDYNEKKEMEKIKGSADVVIDASLLGKGVENGVNLLKEGGRYVTLTTDPQTTVSNKNVEIIGMRGRSSSMTEKEAINYLFDLNKRVGLKLKTAMTFPLTAEGAKKAHEAIIEKKIPGKVLLKSN